MKAGNTADGGDAQRRALTSLFTRFTADRDALATAIRRCEERLDALGQAQPAPHPGGGASLDDERFRQLEHSVMEATREARRAIEVARQSLEGVSLAHGAQGSVEALQGTVAALERRLGEAVAAPPPAAPPAPAPDLETVLVPLEQRMAELTARLDALSHLESRLIGVENGTDTRFQNAVARMAESLAEMDDKVARALDASERALERASEVHSEPQASGTDAAPALGWMRDELEARIEATVSAVKDTRAQLTARLSEITQRGDDTLGRVTQIATCQDALERTCADVSARVDDAAERLADVSERLAALTERVHEVASAATQDRHQTAIARLHARLDVLEANLRRQEPEPSWSVGDAVTRAIKPVVPEFLAGWIWTGSR